MLQFVNLTFTLLLLGICILVHESFEIALVASDCGDKAYYTEDHGSIVSHMGYYHGRNYGKNLYCIWHIEAPVGMNVQLAALNFSTEGDSNTQGSCRYDYLELLDGDLTTSPTLGQFCGSTFRPISSSQRFLTLIFISDGSAQYSGFELYYNFTSEVIPGACHSSLFSCDNGRCISQEFLCDHDDDCGDDSDEQDCFDCEGGQFKCASERKCIPQSWECDMDVDCADSSDEDHCSNTEPINDCGGEQYVDGTSGTVTSPYYPGTYPGNNLCLYIFSVPDSYQGIEFTFGDDFEMEAHSSCEYDSVTIMAYTTNNGSQTTVGPYCGFASPGTINLTGNYAELTFQSDNSNSYHGYSIHWQAYV